MRRLRAPAVDQRGFSLVELLVVMVLIGVVGSVVVSAITTAMRSSSQTQSRIQATQELEIAMQRITRDIRAADPLELSPSGDFDAEAGARVVRGDQAHVAMYSLEEDGTQLWSRVVDADGTVTGSEQTLVTLVSNGDRPVFTYHDTDGSELACDPDCVTAYRGAAQVGIHLVRDLPDGSEVVVDSRVSVRSVRYRSEP